MNSKKTIILSHIKTPETLFTRICDAVSKEEIRTIRRRAWMSLGFALVSGTLFVFAGARFYTDMMQSGFTQTFSLIFSDSSVVMQYWQDFSSLLLEALPYLSLVGSLAALGAVIASFSSVFKYRNVFIGTHAA